MKNINQMTDDEIRELLSKPYSEENAKQFAEIANADSWLLGFNLREMEREENESDSEKGE